MGHGSRTGLSLEDLLSVRPITALASCRRRDFFREEDRLPPFRLSPLPRSSPDEPPRALVTTSPAAPMAAAATSSGAATISAPRLPAADTASLPSCIPLPCSCSLPCGFSSTFATALRASAITARACGEVSVVSRVESHAIGFSRLPCERTRSGPASWNVIAMPRRSNVLPCAILRRNGTSREQPGTSSRTGSLPSPWAAHAWARQLPSSWQTGRRT